MPPHLAQFWAAMGANLACTYAMASPQQPYLDCDFLFFLEWNISLFIISIHVSTLH